LRDLQFVGRPGEHVKALLDEAHRFNAVDQSRRDISAGERGSACRSRVNNLVVLWSQSLAAQKLDQNNVDRSLRYIASNHFPSELFDVGDFFRGNEHEIGTIQRDQTNPNRHTTKRSSSGGADGGVEVQVFGQ